uniref:Putative ribonuclease H-like domain-containing protein n=1 Tax=Tanacetum cinerariifolium TaxID=118510 RepID=A0A699GLE3_TANCI|nr:putative ribonuclease H-like domain-containing protein [Tanacetum cinerariifolium]
MNDFYARKGIKREFSNARTPQQNGVAERRNRTLIEAARTMLADAKLPVTIWAELFNGRTPAIGFFNEQSRDNAPIKGRSLESREETGTERTEKGSDDTKEMVNVLTSLDAATALSSGVLPPGTEVPTGGVPTGSDVVPTAKESKRFKRKGVRLEQDSAKKVKTSKELPEEKLKEMMELIIVEERLVKETLNIRQASNDKEKELWEELKRFYKPVIEDQLWTHTQNLMHAQVEWKSYDTFGVHHVISKDQEMFMLVEKDYPLRKGLAIVMICYKLQVENYSQMANDLILKIYKIANSPRQQDN